MGISWSGSSGRRRNNYYHHQAPPPPLPPPPPPNQPPTQFQFYPSDPPPALPPPPPANYNFAPPSSSSSSSASSPPPVAQPPYFSGHYGACGHPSNHAQNPMMGRFNYTYNQPYYGSHGGNWWPPAVRPPPPHATHFVPPPPVVAPPPYVEHQNAKKVRNDVNVHKDTIRVEVDEENPDHHLVSFEFDAFYDGSITILYFAKEENCKFIPQYPEAFPPVRIPFQKGSGQKFQQPSGTGIDLGFFALDDLSKASPEEDVFPLMISAETYSLQPHSTQDVNDSEDASNNMQITQAVLEKKNTNAFHVKVIRQIIWVDRIRYELRDIYGIGGSSSEGISDNDSGKECIICMTEPKDTFVLPCRHMCMCGECAKELRLQTNKCPICRQPITELVGIKINNDGQ